MLAVMRWPGSDDVLSAERISAGLNTAFVGRSLVYLAEVGSTNEVARQLAMAGAPDSTLVVADYQTAGRGGLAGDGNHRLNWPVALPAVAVRLLP